MSNTQVRSNGAYAPLGANYADDDAIATLDLEENDRAELLYLRGLAYCARDPRTEGYISDIALRAGKVLRRTSVKKRTRTSTTTHDSVHECATVLVSVGLWTREGDGYRITSWLKWNKSWDEITRRRAQDRARKGGSGEDSDGKPDGSHAESARKDSGLQPPEQGSAVQGRSVQGSSKATGDASAAPEPRSGTEAQALLDEHFGDKPLVNGVRNRWLQMIGEALKEAGPDDIRTALTEWDRRPGAKPGLFPHLLADAVTTNTAQQLAADPTSDPDLQAWRDREVAKRQAVTTGATR